ncbi:hypothetical protein PENSPDRAFT_757304 [Peniophora sp. CONT]|nr:hypothetical protein PENSPDRAFT_757304 [Peniophora sp. CONT]
MAIDLLSQSVAPSNAEHLYRHNLEALFWVLVWASYPKGMFMSWEFGTGAQCCEKKHDFLGEEPEVPYRMGCDGLEIVVSDLTVWFKRIHDEREETRHLIKRNKVSGSTDPNHPGANVTADLAGILQGSAGCASGFDATWT